MKALVVLLATLPLLLITIVSYYSEEIWKEITEYISSESETHKSQKKSNRNSSSSEQPKLWKTYSPISILEEAKKTWYKVNNGKLAIGDSNVTEPNKFQLFHPTVKSSKDNLSNKETTGLKFLKMQIITSHLERYTGIKNGFTFMMSLATTVQDYLLNLNSCFCAQEKVFTSTSLFYRSGNEIN